MRVDATRFPLVVHTLDGKQTDEDIDAYLSDCAEIYARRSPFVALTYVREYAMVWSHIGRLAAGMKQFSLEHCRGAALVIPFPAFRFLLSSYYLLHVPPHPIVVFDHDAPAEEWALQRLKDEGLPVPTHLRAAG
jgi:hypothetical protein